MGSWRLTKRTNYGLKLFRQDMWGKYAKKKANNRTVSKQSYYIKAADDLRYMTFGSPIVWYYKMFNKKRENLSISLRERVKQRSFRTRKLLQVLFDTLKIHNIKIHMKKAGIKNGFGSAVNFQKLFERRIDVMCLRANYFNSLREAKQFIKNGYIKVNHQIIQSTHYMLKDKDIINVRDDLLPQYREKYLNDLMTHKILRPLPPYLIRNLRTFDIMFVKEFFRIRNIPNFSNFPWARFPNMRKKP